MTPPLARNAQSSEEKAPNRGVPSSSAPRPLFCSIAPFFSLSLALSSLSISQLTFVLLVPADVEQRRPDPDDDSEDPAQSADDRVRVRPVELEGARGRDGGALGADGASGVAAAAEGGGDGGSSSPRGSRRARGGGADSGAASHSHRGSAHGWREETAGKKEKLSFLPDRALLIFFGVVSSERERKRKKSADFFSRQFFWGCHESFLLLFYKTSADLLLNARGRWRPVRARAQARDMGGTIFKGVIKGLGVVVFSSRLPPSLSPLLPPPRARPLPSTFSLSPPPISLLARKHPPPLPARRDTHRPRPLQIKQRTRKQESRRAEREERGGRKKKGGKK